MKRVLICPSQRPNVACLCRHTPLAAVPLLGQSLIEYWLTQLASEGAKQVMVLCHDGAEAIAKIVADGARWGIEAEIREESRELSAAQAQLKYPLDPEDRIPDAIMVLDSLPGMPGKLLFENYQQFLSTLIDWMPNAVTPDRVGVREIKPGVFVSSGAVVSSKARLLGPCWIGKHVVVGERATVGPNAVIEKGTFVDSGAEISECYVGADTYIGKLARLSHAIALGSNLIDWRTNQAIEVPDSFLLCALREQREGRAARWYTRLSEIYARNREDAAVFWKHLLLNKEG